MLLSFPDSLSGLFCALLGVYLFFASSAINLHFFLGVFLHFITGADNFSSGTLTKDAYLKQREEIDSKLAAAKVEQEAQEQLLSELERQAFQDKEQKDDVFNSFAGATELTAEMAGTFIKEVLVSSPTEIEIVWKFRDVFGGHFGTKEEEVHNG